MQWLRIGLLLLISQTMISQSFITVEVTEFLRAGVPYHFIGTNFWYGMYLGAPEPIGDRARLIRELDRLQALGITNLRVMASSEGGDSATWCVQPALQPAAGVYEEALLQGLDFLLVELAKRDMVAVLCLNNFWPWSGGMAQYVSWSEGSAIPYPPPEPGGDWLKYMNYTARFYRSAEAMQSAEAFIRALLLRKNTISGIALKDDPTIMAWQLANEPRGMFHPRKYRKWVRRTARLIKSLDPNHLVSLGSEGNTHVPTGNHFRKDHRMDEIDYLTIHIWIQNWGWYDPNDPESSFKKALQKAENYLKRHLTVAEKMEKPLVLEEFGIARDAENYAPESVVEWRDRYYETLFSWLQQHIEAGSPWVGCNFWAWAGEGRPAKPKAVWKRGDDLIGDPPHEYQGWYSVYDTDQSTLDLILYYNQWIKNRK
ncbi:MAG: hypothetical protein KDC44_13125 [Phaeodactylibacter sp.]|nr:hypothetical protein [Phaeodactylibacter sp.]